MIKVSDFMIKYFEEIGVTQVFLVSGGALMHILDSLGKSKIKYYCFHHEQAATMASEAYARCKEDIGVTFVTSGPGGTNAITGVAGSWMDSVPHMIISGQVKTSDMIQNTGVRQLGVQEINIIDLVRPITKYSVVVKDPMEIKYHLEKAYHLATTGRPGPVWIDVPLDIQATIVDELKLMGYDPDKEDKLDLDTIDKLNKQVASVVDLIKQSKYPLIYAGHGIRLSKAIPQFMKLIESMHIPVVTARNANDIIPSDHELFIGRPGTYGTRPGNFAVQNCDLIITIGVRLNLSQIGYEYKDWARNAAKVMVDIDKHELNKFTVSPDIKINADAKTFIEKLSSALVGVNINTEDWVKICNNWKKSFPVVLEEYKHQQKVNSYYFVDILSDVLQEGDVVVTDMGISFQGTHQAFKVKKNQRIFTSGGLASMGNGLPAAIGASISQNGKRVICISGDGGLQMNIQELQTMVYNKLPIKLFVINNNGYASIRQTQQQYFGGQLVASGNTTGVTCPDIVKVASAYGIKSTIISSNDNLKDALRRIIDSDEPYVCDVIIEDDQPQIPRNSSILLENGKFASKPIEDMYPFLDRKVYNEQVINRKNQIKEKKQ